MSKHGRINRLLQARRTSGSTVAAPPPVEVPNILEFVTSPRFMNRPKLFPKQALLLKLLFLETELLTPYDHEVIAAWGAGFTSVGEAGERRFEGGEGMAPDVLARMESCRAQGRSWFREAVLVIGRRGSKGYVTALAASYVIWHYLAHGDPQGHFGIEQTKRLTGMVFAGEQNQAADNLFRDVARLIGSAPCFAPYVASTTKHALHLCTPRDLYEGQRPARELAASASVVIDARPTTSSAGRGPAAFMVLCDEIAHLGVDTARSASEMYEAAVPALDQFGVDGLIVQASTPASQLGKFYGSYRTALGLNDDGTPTDPTMLAVQMPSWVPYEDWELTNAPEGLPMFPGGPNFAPVDRPVLAYDDAMRRAERDNPSVFAVERRAQWKTSMVAFLDADIVKAIFDGYQGELLTMQHFGAIGTEYIIHVDPAKNRANFAVAIAHIGHVDERGLPHVVIDAIHVRRPADYADGRIDQMECFDLVKTLILNFAPVSVTFDQFQSAFGIEMLQKWAAEQQLARSPMIYEQTATAQHNKSVANVFRSAAQLGLVHSPRHDLAQQELLHLQERNDRVDHPTFGAVQTSDTSDAIFEVTYRLLSRDIDRWNQLGDLPLVTSQPHGFETWTGPEPSNGPTPSYLPPSFDPGMPDCLGGLGRIRHQGGGMPRARRGRGF